MTALPNTREALIRMGSTSTKVVSITVLQEKAPNIKRGI
jgi:hypothetical protein